MSYFYLKHQTSMALFRTKNIDGKIQLTADLVASSTLINEIKASKQNPFSLTINFIEGIKYTTTKIYEDLGEDEQEEKKIDPTEDLELKDLLDNMEPNAINFDNDDIKYNQTSMHH